MTVVVRIVGMVSVVEADTERQEQALEIRDAGTLVEYPGKVTTSRR